MRLGALLALLLSLAPTIASAQGIALIAEPDECAEVDVAELRDRVALELSTAGAYEMVGEDAADIAVRVREGCEETEVVIAMPGRGIELTRRLALGEGRGAARVWALALVIVDLLRSPLLAPAPAAAVPDEPPDTIVSTTEATAEPAPTDPSAPERNTTEPRATAPTTEPSALPAEPPSDAHEPFETGARVAAAARLYFLTPTVFGGLELGIHHAWLGLALTVLGTDASASSGHLAAVDLLLDVSVRPLLHREGDVTVALELAVSGGVAYAGGRPDPGSPLQATSAWFPSLGGVVRGRTRWTIDPALTLEAALAAGFDVLGSDLYLGSELAATTWGPWIALTLGGGLPL